jgi:hypothetical protein
MMSMDASAAAKVMDTPEYNLIMERMHDPLVYAFEEINSMDFMINNHDNEDVIDLEGGERNTPGEFIAEIGCERMRLRAREDAMRLFTSFECFVEDSLSRRAVEFLTQPRDPKCPVKELTYNASTMRVLEQEIDQALYDLRVKWEKEAHPAYRAELADPLCPSYIEDEVTRERVGTYALNFVAYGAGYVQIVLDEEVCYLDPVEVEGWSWMTGRYIENPWGSVAY